MEAVGWEWIYDVITLFEAYDVISSFQGYDVITSFEGSVDVGFVPEKLIN